MCECSRWGASTLHTSFDTPELYSVATAAISVLIYTHTIRNYRGKNRRSYVQNCLHAISVGFVLVHGFRVPPQLTLNYKITFQILAVLPLTCSRVLRLARSVLSRAFVVALENLQCLSIWYFSQSVVYFPTSTGAAEIADPASI